MVCGSVGAEADITSDGYSWSKRGGYADNVLRPVYDALKHETLGFKKVDHQSSNTPDGSHFNERPIYSNGKFDLVINEHLGGVAYENSYSITLRPKKVAQEKYDDCKIKA